MKQNNFKDMAQIFNPAITPMQLAAIWLTKPIEKGNGEISRRLAPGDRVQIKDGELIDCFIATHEVLECWGTATDQFSVLLKCLETKITCSIKL